MTIFAAARRRTTWTRHGWTPRRSNRLARLWTAGGFALAAVLFVALDGLELLWNSLREAFTSTLADGMTQVDPRSMAIAVVVLLYLMYRKIASLA